MHHVASLTPLHVALNELELAAALVLLAGQESTPTSETLPRLRSALAAVHSARELAGELAGIRGRPALCVLDRASPHSRALQTPRNGSAGCQQLTGTS
jgi:hypothetical protein